jgi:hypothetical protein
VACRPNLAPEIQSYVIDLGEMQPLYRPPRIGAYARPEAGVRIVERCSTIAFVSLMSLKVRIYNHKEGNSWEYLLKRYHWAARPQAPSALLFSPAHALGPRPKA